jgi:hypothetical protein
MAHNVAAKDINSVPGLGMRMVIKSNTQHSIWRR